MAADLHLHTTVSDGLVSPGELVRQAAEAGLRIISITDHDSTDGVPEALEAAQAFPQMTIISGVELSTDVAKGEIHILGYFIDTADVVFQETMAQFREARVDRARRMVGRLADLGMALDWERVRELAGEGSIGRPHIALALQERGYVASVPEAFDRYLGRMGPAYAERVKLTPQEAIGLIGRAGGLAALAHPLDIDDLVPTVRELAQVGLTGIEAYYGGYPRNSVDRLVSLARAHGLLPLGGSDYHGPGLGPRVGLGSARVPLQAGQALLDRHRRDTAPRTR